MDSDQLKSLQAPLKERYRTDPESAKQTMTASSRLVADGVACDVETYAGRVTAGLHEAAGGDGSQACSVNMLLESLAGCAGVTLSAVAAAIGIEVRGGLIVAEGDLDFRGTLAVDKSAPVGITAIRLLIRIQTDANDDQLSQLGRLTERYCVIAQSLNCPVEIECRSTRTTL